MQIKKELGRFSIVAENPLVDLGYSKVDGTPLNESDIWKDNVFYEQDYYHVICAKNLRVVDAQGMNISPIIEKIEIKNRGYVCTWVNVFWVQGFVVFEDEIYFVSKSSMSDGFYGCKLLWHRVKKTAPAGQVVGLERFLAEMVEPCEPPPHGDKTLDSISRMPAGFFVQGPFLSDFMLLE